MGQRGWDDGGGEELGVGNSEMELSKGLTIKAVANKRQTGETDGQDRQEHEMEAIEDEIDEMEELEEKMKKIVEKTESMAFKNAT